MLSPRDDGVAEGCDVISLGVWKATEATLWGCIIER